MTIGDVSLVKLYQLSSFTMYLKNLFPRTGLPQRKEITIKTRALIQSLNAAGLAISISLPVLAEEINLNNAPTPAESMECMNDMPPENALINTVRCAINDKKYLLKSARSDVKQSTITGKNEPGRT